MLRKWQPALFPATLIACLLLSLAQVSAPLETPTITQLKAVGGGTTPSAYIGYEALDTTTVVDVSRLNNSFLFTNREKMILWLGSYKLVDVKTYSGDYKIIILILREGGKGNALLLQDLEDETEIYALFDRGDEVEITPLARVIAEDRLLEISGEAEGAFYVAAYAYAYPEDFNATVGPSSKLLVAKAQVVKGRYIIRLEKRGGPVTPRGKPLIEVNSTLIVYAGCSYGVIDLSNITSSRLTVNLNCRG